MLFPLFLANLLIFFNSCSSSQIFNSTGELTVPTETSTNETNAEIQVESSVAETNIRKCLK